MDGNDVIKAEDDIKSEEYFNEENYEFILPTHIPELEEESNDLTNYEIMESSNEWQNGIPLQTTKSKRTLKKSKNKELPKKSNNPPSAYALFIKDYKKDLCGLKLGFTQMTKTCANKWREMSIEEKEKFHKMSRIVRQNMRQTAGPAVRGHRKDTKTRKKTNYWNFAQTVRQEIYNRMKDSAQNENKSVSMRDVNKEIGIRWRQLSSQEKDVYRNVSIDS